MTLSLLFIVDGALDRPLLHSQGLPLLRCLAEQGLRCYILSFESALDVTQSPLGADLERRGIQWEVVIMPPQASGKQRVHTILGGFARAWRLCRREAIQIVHCRSYRPAVIGALLKRVLGAYFVFDMRGFLIDELVADGRWREGTSKYKIGKLFERWLVLKADVITTTSPQFSAAVYALSYFPPVSAHRVISIPNCADFQKFKPDEMTRQATRQCLGWQDRYVILFAGVADRYRRSYKDLFRFFSALREREPRALLAMLAYDDLKPLRETARAMGISEADMFYAQVPSSQMPDYLNAADVGLALFRITSPAHAIASPVKFAEYLACGLPVVINTGVGDTERILNTYHVGIAVNIDDEDSVTQSVEDILRLGADPNLRVRCRQAAQIELSLDMAVERYLTVYRHFAKTSAKH